MLSENSYSSKGSVAGISGTWMKHLSRRFIVISLIALFGYFLFIHLPMILNMGNPLAIFGYSEGVAKGTNFGVLMIISYLSVATSAMVFDYLHDTASVTLTHSFPLTRGKLFRSSVLAGYLMMLIPIAVAAISMFVISRFTEPILVKPDLREVYSLTNSLKWFADTTVAMTFSYAVATFAGILAGNTVMHVILAFVLEGVPQLSVLVYKLYMSEFIYGMDAEIDVDGELSILSPSTHYLVRDAMLSSKDIAFVLGYLGIAIALFIISGLLYKKIKLEREKSTVVFKPVGDLLAMYFTFISMSIFGMVFYTLLSENAENDTALKTSFIIPAVIGGIISFIIFRMIADGSVKIFNFKNMMKFLVFSLIAGLIFAVTVFDALGLAKRVPSAADVDSVRMELDFPFPQSATLTGKEDIEKVTGLHEQLIDSKDAITHMEGTFGEIRVTVNYSLKSGGTLRRAYNIPHPMPTDEIKNSVDDIVSRDAFMSSVENRVEKWVRTRKTVNISTQKTDYLIPDKHVEGLVKAYMKDYRNNKLSYRSELEEKYFEDEELQLSFSKERIGRITFDREEGYDLDYNYDSMLFGPKDKNTIKYLEKSGIAKDIRSQEKSA